MRVPRSTREKRKADFLECHPASPLSPFQDDKPRANLAHLRATTTHPAHFDVNTTACTNWKRNKSRHFFGRRCSYILLVPPTTRNPPHANISSRNTDYILRRHLQSCFTTPSSTSSATRLAARPPIGPRNGPIPPLHIHFFRKVANFNGLKVANFKERRHTHKWCHARCDVLYTQPHSVSPHT